MRLVFEVAGDKLIERDLLRIGEYAQDASPAFGAIAELMMAETADQFDTEGGHASGGWRPLKPSTLANKQRLLERGQIKTLAILRATDALKDSLTRAGAEHQILEVGPQELSFGSDLAYALYHQTGTSKMPRRRPLEFTESAKRAMVKILQRYIVTGEVAV